jgi:glutathione peroxidase
VTRAVEGGAEWGHIAYYLIYAGGSSMLKRQFALLCGLFFALPAAAADSPVDINALLGHQLKRLHSSEVVDLLQRYRGKPLLFVNTASRCGFTGQFAGLEALHQRYQAQGLVVAGFPSNSFRQEEDEESETANVCFINYGVTFDMFAPIPVRGRDAHPIFQELARQAGAPKWNFYKYLIDRDGRVVASFASTTKPDSPSLRRAIESLLE